jgi:hypothetical protein
MGNFHAKSLQKERRKLQSASPETMLHEISKPCKSPLFDDEVNREVVGPEEASIV